MKASVKKDEARRCVGRPASTNCCHVVAAMSEPSSFATEKFPVCSVCSIPRACRKFLASRLPRERLRFRHSSSFQDPPSSPAPQVPETFLFVRAFLCVRCAADTMRVCVDLRRAAPDVLILTSRRRSHAVGGTDGARSLSPQAAGRSHSTNLSLSRNHLGHDNAETDERDTSIVRRDHPAASSAMRNPPAAKTCARAGRGGRSDDPSIDAAERGSRRQHEQSVAGSTRRSSARGCPPPATSRRPGRRRSA